MAAPFAQLTRAFKNQQGSALLLVIGLSLALMVSSAVMTQWLQYQVQMSANSEYLSKVQFIQSRLIATIQDDAAWAQTQAYALNGSVFDCLASNTCTQTARTFVLVARDGQVVFDGRSAFSGFDLQGRSCNTFDKDRGNSDCPFSYELTWAADCTSCNPQSVQVQGVFVYKFGNDKINLTKNMNFNIIRGKTLSLADNCKAMGGYVDVNNGGRCVLPIIAPNCVNGQVMVGGSSADGRRICRPMAAVNSPCPGATAAVGFGPRGEVQCVPLAAE